MVVWSVLTRLREIEEETGRIQLLARAFWGDFKAHPQVGGAELRLRYGPDAPVRDLFPGTGFELCRRMREHLGRIEDRIEELRRLRRAA